MSAPLTFTEFVTIELATGFPRIVNRKLAMLGSGEAIKRWLGGRSMAQIGNGYLARSLRRMELQPPASVAATEATAECNRGAAGLSTASCNGDAVAWEHIGTIERKKEHARHH